MDLVLYTEYENLPSEVKEEIQNSLENNNICSGYAWFYIIEEYSKDLAYAKLNAYLILTKGMTVGQKALIHILW